MTKYTRMKDFLDEEKMYSELRERIYNNKHKIILLNEILENDIEYQISDKNTKEHIIKDFIKKNISKNNIICWAYNGLRGNVILYFAYIYSNSIEILKFESAGEHSLSATGPFSYKVLEALGILTIDMFADRPADIKTVKYILE